MSPSFIILFSIAGLVLGSFGNVLIARVPHGKSIGGRSACPGCNRTLRVVELMPVVSFLLQRGKCRGCGMRISWQYPLVELAAACLFLAAALLETSVLASVGLGIGLWGALLVAVVDLRTQTIPDIFTLLVFLGALLRWLPQGVIPWLPALVGLAFFGLQWLLSRGRWVGSGDMLLAAALGALVGTWQLLVLLLFIAYILGALTASILLLRKQRRLAEHIAFGPFLVAALSITILWGRPLLERLG